MEHRQTRRALLQAGGVAAVAGVAGCVDSFAGSAYDVGMTATEYQPETITIAVGETVVWENTSSRRHTVTAFEALIPEEATYFASGGFETESAAREAYWEDFGGEVDTGEQYEHTFEVAGEYEYVCIPHDTAGMEGTVIVE